MSPWLIKSHLAEEQTLDAVLAIAVTLSTGKDPQRTPMTYWSEVLFIDFALAACREKNLMKWGAHHRNNFGNMRGNETQKQRCDTLHILLKHTGEKTLNFVKPLVIITFSSCGAIRPLILWSPPLPLLSICGTRRHFIMWSPPLPLLCHTSRKEDHPFCEDLCYSYLFYLLKLCHTVVKEK